MRMKESTTGQLCGIAIICLSDDPAVLEAVAQAAAQAGQALTREGFNCIVSGTHEIELVDPLIRAVLRDLDPDAEPAPGRAGGFISLTRDTRPPKGNN